MVRASSNPRLDPDWPSSDTVLGPLPPDRRSLGVARRHYTLVNRRALWDQTARSVSGPLTMPRAESEPELDMCEVLDLVNRGRRALHIDPVRQLTLRYARRKDPERCVLALALRCNVFCEGLRFEDPTQAGRVAIALGAEARGTGVELPDLLGDFAVRFDAGLIRERDLWMPVYEQLDFELSPVEQAMQTLEDVSLAGKPDATAFVSSGVPTFVTPRP